MSRSRIREIVILGIAVVTFTGLVAGVAGLPHFGENRGTTEQRRNEFAVKARHVTNLDAFVNFDLRGADTLGEEFILFTAIAGLALLLRDVRGKKSDDPMAPAPGRVTVPPAEGVRAFAPAAIVAGVAIAFETMMHGQLTPGGGFQGGVMLAGAFITVWIAYGYTYWQRLTNKDRIEPVEALGAAAYVATGIASVLAGAAFLQNVAPLGGTGAVLSGGTIWILNLAIALEVTFAFLVMLAEFTRETRMEIEE